MKRIALAALLWSHALMAAAQEPGRFAWETVADRLNASKAVSALGPNFAGDQVSLSNGALSFQATDVSLPGNGSLEVAFSRSYSVRNRKDTVTDEMLADWSVDLPHISGVFTTDWIVPGATPGNRCSDTALPPLPGNGYIYSDYWQGLSISLPGGGGGDLQAARSDIAKPTVGGPYPWVTENGTVHLSCLATLKNRTGQEQGFLAVLPDGTKVWYDWMAQHYETPMKGNQVNVSGGGTPMYWIQPRRRNVLYATRVEDRFGNYVTYTYSNAWNAPGKLTRIQANDGRQIDVTYSGSHIASISDGSRTWTYGYVAAGGGRRSLRSVGLPDSSAWTINFTPFTDAEIKYNEAAFDEPLRSCTMVETPLNYDQVFTGTITHPAGATATFSANIREHGRSHVPVACGRVSTMPVGAPPGSGNNTNDDLNLYAISDNSLTLWQKQVSGPAIATATWSYAYSPSISVYRYPGTTWLYPVCDWDNYDCSQPPCTSDACATPSITTVTGPNGEWSRYYYGNTYRYNEGKLLRVESGTSATNILKRVIYTYDLSLANQAYPAYYGSSRRINGDGFPSMYHRPLIKTRTDQQDVSFTYEVNAFDAFARPARVTRASSAVGPVPAFPAPPTPPVPPPPLSTPVLTAPASAQQGSTFLVSWTSISNATSYVLERRTGVNPYTVAYTGPNTSATPLAHTVGTSTFRVKACNPDVCSAYSAEKNVSISGGGGGGIEP
jgi:hypothetical protein